ncbi:MAG: PAS domain S-box protein [Acidobacteria bacterium]|nr:PAS domain S-box protein [Acidobacteriota bacterium]
MTANPALAHIWGYSSVEELTANVSDVRSLYVDPARRDELLHLLELRRMVTNFEAQYRSRNRVGWISMNARAVRDPEGRFVGLEGTLIDITDRKQAEEALRQSEERYRQFFEENLAGAFISTAGGRLVACNPAFVRIFGFQSVAQALNGDLRSIYPSRKAREDMLQLLRKEKKLQNHEMEHRRLDGKPVYVIANVIGTFNEQGELVEIKGYVFDNTERRQLEAQLFQSQKMEAVGRLAGGVAHDFNNVLTGIMGYTQLLLQEVGPDAAMHRELAQINELAKRAADLTRQLLAFSRKQTLEPVVLNINLLVENTSRMLKTLIGEDVSLKFIPATDAGNVRADPGQLEQVLMNLALNARDAMPRGGTLIIETAKTNLVRDDLLADEEIKPGPYVMVAVTDTGVGMDAATRERIFEPFFTTKETGKGTGLGLSTVHGIVKQHNGHIFVYSEPEKGATFKVYLPRVDIEAQQLAVKARREPMLRGSETILLVEDEKAVRSLLQTALQTQGYIVLSASRPDQAEELVAQHLEDIALLLTDFIMPGRTGKELYQRLASRHPTLKVLYMSGYMDRDMTQDGRLEAGTPFLQKPFALTTLTQKVRDVLDR